MTIDAVCAAVRQLLGPTNTAAHTTEALFEPCWRCRVWRTQGVPPDSTSFLEHSPQSPEIWSSSSTKLEAWQCGKRPRREYQGRCCGEWESSATANAKRVSPQSGLVLLSFRRASTSRRYLLPYNGVLGNFLCHGENRSPMTCKRESYTSY